MMKYSDDTINQMVRKALYLEKTKQYEEALNIYMELASFGNEFSRERIPLIKHKLEQSKLELKQSYHEINEIQNVIINTKMSASDGYILCRDLQKALIRKNELQKTVSELTSISEGVMEKYEEINKKINKIKNKIKSQQTVLLINNTMQ